MLWVWVVLFYGHQVSKDYLQMFEEGISLLVQQTACIH